MANPQKENGFTQIANELIEKLAGADLSGREFRILLVVMRKTWGWKKKADRIALSQIEGLTGIEKRHVSGLLARLVKRGFLKRGIPENGKGVRTYQLEKDYDLWDAPSYPQLFPIGDKGFPKTGYPLPESGKGRGGVRIPEFGNHKRKKLLQKGARGTFLRKSGDKPRAHTDGAVSVGDLLKKKRP